MSARLRHARRLSLTLATTAAITASGVTLLPAAASAAATPTCASAGVTITALHGPVFFIDPSAKPTALTSAYAGYQVSNATGAALADTWVQLSGFTGGSVALGGGQPAAEQIPALGTGRSKSLFWYLTAGVASATAQNHTITVYTHRPDLADATVLCTASGGFGSVASTIGANANKISSVDLSTQTPSLGSTFSVTVNGNTGTIGDGPANDPGSFWMSPSSISGWPAAAYRLVGTSLLISPDGNPAQQTYTDLLHLTNLGSGARDYAATYTFQAAGFTASDATLQPAQQIASGTQIKHTGSYPATIPAIHPATNTLSVVLSRSPVRLPTGGGTASYTATLSGTAGATVDSFSVTLPSGASVVPGSASYGGAAIGDPSSNGTALVFQGPFALGSSPAPLTFQVSFDGTTGTRTVSASASVGSTVIDSTPNTLTDNVPATAAVVVDTAPVATDDSPTVSENAAATTVGVLGNDTDADGDTLTVSGVGAAAHGTATLTGGVVRYAPTAGYNGPDAFTYSISDGNGGTSTATVHVDVAALATQTITFPQPADVSVHQTGVTLTAGAGSGAAVVFSSSAREICDVDPVSGAVTLHGVGTCTVSADQPGAPGYAPAGTVTRSFEVTDTPALTTQAISFTPPVDVDIDATGVTMTAIADSGLDVTFSSDTSSVCSVDAVTGAVTLLATGTCTITATQPGDASRAPAPPVTHSFLVSPGSQIVTANQPPATRLGAGPVVVSGNADSGLAVTYRSTTSAVCTVDAGGTVTLVGPGPCSIVVEQAGTARYAPASTTVDFTVRPDLIAQMLTFPAPGDVAVTSGSTVVTATSSSGLTPTYNSLTPAVCTVDAAGTVTLFHTGACTLQADQAGDGTYDAAPPAGVTFDVLATAQTITFPQPADVVVTATDAAVAATASSGLPATYSSSTAAVCTVDSAGNVTPHLAGVCSITAHQAGDATYSAAPDVTRDFTVSHAAATINAVVPATLDVTAGPTGFPATSSSGQPVTVTAGPTGVCTATITAGEVTLVPVAAGACTVTLAAPGTPVFGPVTRTYPVTITATVTNDVYTVPPSASAGSGMVLHVLANDTPGMTLVSVTQPAHGHAALGGGGTLTFTPTASFKGTETFTYTTVDGDGGQHTATVTVTVPDTAPVVHPGTTGTVAGRTGTVTLHPTDVNGDAVVLRAGHVAGAAVHVAGHVLRVVPARSFSGFLRIPVTADDGDGGITSTVVTVRVDPLPASHAVRTLTQSGTRVQWSATPATDARYEIRVDGKPVCVTPKTGCIVDSLIGPRARVVVTVLGHERTRSELTLAVPRLGAAVRVGTVYFATDNARPSRTQRAVALAIKLRLYRAGFSDLSVIGFTDSRGSTAYNVALSRRRALAVQHLLGYGAHISVRSSWRGKSHPAQSNATAWGMALNRRVEVWIR